MGIEHIKCSSRNLKSLEGCPNGLKSLDMYGYSLLSLEPFRGFTELESLVISNPCRISDLSPLASCTKIKKLTIGSSRVSDLSLLSSMSLLEELVICFCDRIKSLDPLSGLMNLRKINCQGIDPQTSLLPLASCTGLDDLWFSRNAVDLELLKKKLG